MSNEINQDDDVMGLFEYFDIEKFKTTVDVILKAAQDLKIHLARLSLDQIRQLMSAVRSELKIATEPDDIETLTTIYKGLQICKADIKKVIDKQE